MTSSQAAAEGRSCRALALLGSAAVGLLAAGQAFALPDPDRSVDRPAFSSTGYGQPIEPGDLAATAPGRPTPGPPESPPHILHVPFDVAQAVAARLPDPLSITVEARRRDLPEPLTVTIEARRLELPDPVVLNLEARRQVLPEPFALTLEARRRELPDPVVLSLEARRQVLPEPAVLTLEAKRQVLPDPFTITVEARRQSLPEPFALTLEARREAPDAACDGAAVKVAEAKRLAVSGTLGAADAALATVDRAKCPALGPDIATVRKNIDADVATLARDTEAAIGACEAAALTILRARLRTADHPRLAGAAARAAAVAAAAGAARAAHDEAAEHYVGGAFDRALDGLARADSLLDAAGDRTACTDLRTRIASARQRTETVRDNVAKVEAAIAACDTARMAELRAQIGSLSRPHPALAAFRAPLDRAIPRLGTVTAAFDRGRARYEAGDLGAARSALNEADASLRSLEGDPACPDLARRIADGQTRIDTLQSVLGKADAAMRACRITEIDQWLTRFRASPSHVLIREKIPALAEAGARCTTSGVDAAIRRCDLAAMRQFAAGLAAATDADAGKARRAIAAAMPKCLAEAALKKCRTSFGDLSRVINVESEDDIQCGCVKGADWNANRTRCVRLAPAKAPPATATTCPSGMIRNRNGVCIYDLEPLVRAIDPVTGVLKPR